MLFKLSNLNSNLALILGYLNPALNNSALDDCVCVCAELQESLISHLATHYMVSCGP